MIRLHISPVEGSSKGASHEASVAEGFLLYWRWIWQLVDRKGLAIGLKLGGKGGCGCNVLGSSEVRGQNMVGGAGPRTIMLAKQVATDTHSIFCTHLPYLFVVPAW